MTTSYWVTQPVKLFLLPSVLVLVIATGAIYYIYPIGCSYVSRWSVDTSIEWDVSLWLTQVWEHHYWLWIHAFRWHWTAYVKAARSWRRRGYHGEVWNMTAVPLGRSFVFALHNELEWTLFLIFWKSINWIHPEFPLAMIYARSMQPYFPPALKSKSNQRVFCSTRNFGQFPNRGNM
jgi:hypothetical protein